MITVKNFIDGFVKNPNEEYIKSHIVKSYVPFEHKVSICERIVKNTTVDGNGAFKLNTPTQSILYYIAIIKEYTDLEINYKDSLIAFNQLDENLLIDMIINFIPDHEVKRFNEVLRMVRDDYMYNERDLVSYIDNLTRPYKIVLNSLIQDKLGVDSNEE